MKSFASLLLITLSAACSLFCQAQTYSVSQTIPLGGNGAWDYLRADAESRRLYVSHSGEVLVLDLDTRQIVGRMTGFGFIHGIVILNDLKKGFISDGQKNEVIVFDPVTLTVKSRIATAANPNSMVYEPSTGRLFVGHKPSKSMTVIDAASEKIQGHIAVGGIPEFPATDGDANIYVNIDDTSEILHIDARTLKVKHRWPVSPCKSPSGLAMDVSGRRLFAACDNKLMTIVDANTGKVLSTLKSGEGPDAAGYDPGTHLAFASNGDGTLTVVAAADRAQAQVIQSLTTEPGARTMTLDEKTHNIYLSTATLGPPPAPTKENPNPPKHPTAVAGSFKLLVVSLTDATK